jgi:hypothetical protein
LKTLRAEEVLAGAVVICKVWSLVVALWLLVFANGAYSGQYIQYPIHTPSIVTNIKHDNTKRKDLTMAEIWPPNKKRGNHNFTPVWGKQETVGRTNLLNLWSGIHGPFFHVEEQKKKKKDTVCYLIKWNRSK